MRMENVGSELTAAERGAVASVQVWRHLGIQVRTLRTRRSWTQSSLADLLRRDYGVDMHQTTLAKLEGGVRPTVAHEIWALARAFGVDYSDLLPPLADEPGDVARARRDFDEAKLRLEDFTSEIANNERNMAHLELLQEQAANDLMTARQRLDDALDAAAERGAES